MNMYSSINENKWQGHNIGIYVEAIQGWDESIIGVDLNGRYTNHNNHDQASKGTTNMDAYVCTVE